MKLLSLTSSICILKGISVHKNVGAYKGNKVNSNYVMNYKVINTNKHIHRVIQIYIQHVQDEMLILLISRDRE